MSFDRIARPYRLLETLAFGRALQVARVRWIGDLATPLRALLVGEGDGRFLCVLLRHHPKIEIDCVDASARMLSLAWQRAAKTCPESFGRVRFIRENIQDWSTQQSYDLLVTHFFLDCGSPTK